MTKAIILAAGQGARLRPFTEDRPKCLVPYQGKPILEHELQALRSAGVTDILLVAGHKAEKLAPYGLKIFINEQYAQTNMVRTLFCAEEVLQGDIIISYADIVYRSETIRALLESRAPISVVVDCQWRKLWQSRMADPLSDAESMRIDSAGNITELGLPVSDLNQIQGQYIGLLKFSADTWPQVRSLYHKLDRNIEYRGKSFDQMYMTTFIQLIIDRLMPVKAVMIDGGWMEIDAPSDLNCSMI